MSITVFSQNLWMETISGVPKMDSLAKRSLDEQEFNRNFAEALKYADLLNRTVKESNDKKLVAFCKNTYGTLFRMNGNYNLALKYYSSSTKILGREHGNLLAYIYYNMYRTYVEKSDFKRALLYLNKSLKIYESEENAYGICRIKIEIGGLHLYMQNLDFSRKYLVDSKKISEKLKDQNLVYLTNLYYINLLLAQQKDSEALNYGITAVDGLKKLKNKKLLGYYYETISAIYSDQKKFNTAASYIDSTIATTERLSEIANLKMQKAGIYTELKNYADAESLLMQSLNDLQKTKRIDYQLQAHEMLAALYQKTNQKEKQAEEIIIGDELKTKLSQNDTKNALREYEYITALDKNAKELSAYKSSVNFFKLATITSIAVLLILIAYLYNFLKKSKKRKSHDDNTMSHLVQEKQKTERELASTTLRLNENKKVLQNIKEELSHLEEDKSEDLMMKRIAATIRSSLNTDKDWERMVIHFEKVNPNFFLTLKQQNPNLSVTELKHCAYLKINLTNKETARIMGIEPASVKVARYRLKKKLNVPHEETLYTFISKI